MAQQGRISFQDPPIAKLLFSDTRLAWIWLPIRIWLGWQWLEAGLHKFEDPAWTSTGAALAGFWQKAVTVAPGAKPAIAYDWYRGFLEFLLNSGSAPWFAKLVVFGEIFVGVALIIGAFTGIAAFFGVFMNWHYVMAGAASTNALLGVAAMVIILAWKVAGYYGVDRYLLPVLGTPWQRHPAPVAEPEQRPAARPRTAEQSV